MNLTILKNIEKFGVAYYDKYLKIWDKEQGKWISLEELIEKENLCENGGRNIQKN